MAKRKVASEPLDRALARECYKEARALRMKRNVNALHAQHEAGGRRLRLMSVDVAAAHRSLQAALRKLDAHIRIAFPPPKFAPRLDAFRKHLTVDIELVHQLHDVARGFQTPTDVDAAVASLADPRVRRGRG